MPAVQGEVHCILIVRWAGDYTAVKDLSGAKPNGGVATSMMTVAILAFSSAAPLGRIPYLPGRWASPVVQLFVSSMHF